MNKAARVFLLAATFLVVTDWLVPGSRVFADDPAKPKVVCFGDSITRRGYNEILARLVDVDAINAGVGGHSSAKGLRRIKADVLDQNPDVVVVLFGTNDLRADAPHVYVAVDKYKENLNTIVSMCKKQGAAVVLCTLPPIEHTAFYTRHKREPFDALGGLGAMIATYCNAAREVAKQNGVSLVDLNDRLTHQPAWLSKDGVHPSVEGNAIIAKEIAKAVEPLVRQKKPATR